MTVISELAAVGKLMRLSKYQPIMNQPLRPYHNIINIIHQRRPEGRLCALSHKKGNFVKYRCLKKDRPVQTRMERLLGFLILQIIIVLG